MLKRKLDYYFLLCLVFIGVLSIFFVFEYLQQQKLDKYLTVLHDGVSEMITDERTRGEFEAFYNDFINQVNNDSIDQSQIRQFAENIIAVKKEKIEISQDDLKRIISIREPAKREQLNSSVLSTKTEKRQDWQALTKRFAEQSAACDTLHEHLKLSKRLANAVEEQLGDHEQLSRTYGKNLSHSERRVAEIAGKFESEVTVYGTYHIEKSLQEEIDRIKKENKALQKKISSLDEMQKMIEQEREKLQDELNKIHANSKQ